MIYFLKTNCAKVGRNARLTSRNSFQFVHIKSLRQNPHPIKDTGFGMHSLTEKTAYIDTMKMLFLFLFFSLACLACQAQATKTELYDLLRKLIPDSSGYSNVAYRLDVYDARSNYAVKLECK